MDTVTNPAATEKASKDVKGWDLLKIKEEFKQDFCDEIRDCNKYCDMANMAEQLGDEKLHEYLSLIAWDEYTHAKCIHDYLVDWGYEIPEKEAIKWHELKERIHRKFRKR